MGSTVEFNDFKRVNVGMTERERHLIYGLPVTFGPLLIFLPVVRVPEIFTRAKNHASDKSTRTKISQRLKHAHTKSRLTKIPRIHFHADHERAKTKSRSSKIPPLPKSHRPKIPLRSCMIHYHGKGIENGRVDPLCVLNRQYPPELSNRIGSNSIFDAELARTFQFEIDLIQKTIRSNTASAVI
jgi:hypothetical protein